MTSELITHKRFLPAFGLADHEDQMPLCLYTILSVNRSVKDCAAYEGVGPTMNGWDQSAIEQMTETIKAGGAKISEEEARKMFDEIENLGLRYRR